MTIFIRLAIVSQLLTIFAQFSYAEDTFRIGFIGPLSGELANFGNDERNATTLAVDEINQSNYIPGLKLAVVFEDSKCSGKDATTAAQKLITIDKLNVILGGTCSGETLGAAPIAEKNQAILFSVFSSHPDITKAGDFIFRNSINDADGAKLMAHVMYKTGYKTVGALSENTDYALGLRDHFVKAFQAEGGAKIVEETFNPSETDFRPLLLRLRASNPQSLFLNPQGGMKAGLLVKQIRQLKWDIPLYGTFAYSSPDAAKAAGGIGMLEGVRFIDAPEVTRKKGKDFLEKFRKVFAAPQSEFQVCMRYDSVYLLADAIKKGGTKSANIRDYLYQLPNYEGTAFDYHFDKNGDPVGVPYALKEVKEGKLVTIEK